jgi:hypothetical protein
MCFPWQGKNTERDRTSNILGEVANVVARRDERPIYDYIEIGVIVAAKFEIAKQETSTVGSTHGKIVVTRNVIPPPPPGGV